MSKRILTTGDADFIGTHHISRRKFLSLVSLPIWGGLLNISACSNLSLKERIIKSLSVFLNTHFISSSMQCGTRLGDGVPAYTDVEAFIGFLNKTNEKNISSLVSRLDQAREEDLAGDSSMIIDGWVYSKTEVLVSAAYVVLTNTSCNLSH